MSFSKEIEIDSCLAFLDIKIEKSIKFITSIYRKPTFSGIYLNFKSHAPTKYKSGLIYCLLYRIFNLCSNWDIIHREINNIKAILLRNKYPLNFIDTKKYTDRLRHARKLTDQDDAVMIAYGKINGVDVFASI